MNVAGQLSPTTQFIVYLNLGKSEQLTKGETEEQISVNATVIQLHPNKEKQCVASFSLANCPTRKR